MSKADGNHCADCGGSLVFANDAAVEMCLGCEMLMHAVLRGPREAGYWETCADRHAKVCPKKVEHDSEALATWTAGVRSWEPPRG